MKKAIDYVVGFLVNDAFEALKYIIGELSAADRNELLPLIEYNAAYLKYGFDARVRDPSADACIFHSIDYGLSTSGSVQPCSRRLCSECHNIFQFYSRLKEMVAASGIDESALVVIDDCCEKAKLYFAHRVRVVNQQRAIKDALTGMRQRCLEDGLSDEALVIIDFKMKLEPMYHREKTVDHYGNVG